MSTYRIAVVGLSPISTEPAAPAPAPALGLIAPHAHLAAWATLPNVELVAVCDIDPARLEAFRREWGRRFPNAVCYADHRSMLAQTRIDMLTVATPDDRHAAIVLDAVAAGVRGIFCEKPIATTLAEADAMIAACARAGVPLLINHSRRWYPEFAYARQLIRQGAIGPLRRVVATLGGPRAMLFRNGTHLIDAVTYFVEAEPRWMMAELDDELNNDYGPRYAGDGGRDPATDPGLSGYIHFANGARAFINASKGTPPLFELDLIGETGRLRLGNWGAERWHPVDGGFAVAPLLAPRTTRSGTAAALQELIDLVERGGQGSSTGEDGRRVLAILLGLLQSGAAMGQPVHWPVTDA